MLFEMVIVARTRFDLEKCQKEIFAPAHFMCDPLVLFKAISARASPIKEALKPYERVKGDVGSKTI